MSFTCHRAAAVAVAVLAGGAAVAGCGSHSHTTATHPPATATQSPTTTPAGPTTTTTTTTTAGTGGSAGSTSPTTAGKPITQYGTNRVDPPGPQLDQIGDLPHPTGPAKSTSSVTVIPTTPATNAALLTAFNTAEQLTASCPAHIASTVYLATVKSTNVSFAVTGINPYPTCIIGGRPAEQVPPFGTSPSPVGAVFERQPGKAWVMNSQTGSPFPCPPGANTAPGPNNGIVPKDVLDAWHIPYYSNNCFGYTPDGLFGLGY